MASKIWPAVCQFLLCRRVGLLTSEDLGLTKL